jgi:hypothetical protein
MIDNLRDLVADAIYLAEHGDYANGNTDPGGSSDEGWYMFGQVMDDLRLRAKELGVELPGEPIAEYMIRVKEQPNDNWDYLQFSKSKNLSWCLGYFAALREEVQYTEAEVVKIINDREETVAGWSL